MTVLTTAAVLALVTARQCVSPSVAPIVVGIAAHESGNGTDLIRPYAIHDNASGKSYFPDTAEQAVVIARSLIAVGHASLDLGAGQVNTANLAWTGLTLERAFDVCRNLTASASILFARYNGNPSDLAKASYAQATTVSIAVVEGVKPFVGHPAGFPTPFTHPSRSSRTVSYDSATEKEKQ